MKRNWWQDISKEELDRLIYIKKLDAIKSLYKLLAVIRLGYNRSEELIDLFGGNYIVLVRDGALKGLIEYSRGQPPKLTEKGEKIADIIIDCIERFRQLENSLSPSLS